MEGGTNSAAVTPSRPPKKPKKSGGKNCFCSNKWCQLEFSGGCDQANRGHPFGGHRVSAIPDDVLRKWMHHPDHLLTGEDPQWTADAIEELIAQKRSKEGRYAAMYVGRWHFPVEWLGVDGRGRTILNFAEHPDLVPSVSRSDALAARDEALGEVRATPKDRRDKRLREELVSPPQVISQLLEEARQTEVDNERLRAVVTGLRGTLKASNQAAEVAKLEQELLDAEATIFEQAAALEQLAARPKAWLSHEALLTDPALRAAVKDITFFGSPEEHDKFFELLNADGLAENLVLYRENLEETEKDRKQKYAPKPGLRRMLAQDQFLMFCVIMITGDPLSLVGAMFGGVSSPTISRIFVTWANFLYLWFREEFPYPSREQVQNCMPAKFLHIFGSDKIRQIIDCTEIQMEKGSEPQAARCCWSEYKHRYTVKLLAAISPVGAFTWVSEAFGGRISDGQIIEASEWLDLIEELDQILADKGFNINARLADKFAHCEAPPKKYTSQDFTDYENASTAIIAQMRMHVERAFGRLKLKCRYFDGILPITSIDLVGRLFYVCAMFMNYKAELVGSDFGQSQCI